MRTFLNCEAKREGGHHRWPPLFVHSPTEVTQRPFSPQSISRNGNVLSPVTAQDRRGHAVGGAPILARVMRDAVLGHEPGNFDLLICHAEKRGTSAW
jgi:hypothetical protein